MNLTDDEILKLWEGCGFKRVAGCYYDNIPQHSHSSVCYKDYFLDSDGRRHLGLPSVDLNNLFKYSPFARIEVDNWNMEIPEEFSREKSRGLVVDHNERFSYGVADDPAEALARAMLKAFEEKEGKP